MAKRLLLFLGVIVASVSTQASLNQVDFHAMPSKCSRMEG